MPDSSNRSTISRGETLLARGNVDAALEEFEAVLERDPYQPDALNDAAIAYAHRQEPSKALTYYERALAERGDHVQAFYNLLDLVVETEIASPEKIFGKYETEIPASLKKDYYSAVVRSPASKKARRELHDLSDRAVLEQLVEIWDNEWAASVDYLEAVVEGGWNCNGAVLECGSGLTTYALGMLGKLDAAAEIVSLEHHPHWFEKIRLLLAKQSMDSVRVLHTPLTDFGPFEWYDVGSDALPSDIELVVCDGPPGETKGGRFGLLPTVKSNLGPESRILLDDVERPAERKILELWKEEYNVTYEIVPADRSYAVVEI